jgi:hypothetical protein
LHKVIIHEMRRLTLQLLLLLLLASLCLGGYLTARHILKLPFRPTNDVLHQRGSDLTLDFLIPAGTYLDERITIGEVIKIRFKKEGSFFEKVLKAIAGLIPPRYRLLADLLLFCFWFFCFMALFRIFTFMGYSRALRASLLLGGITYYFMPDFSPGRLDDVVFLGIPLLIIALRIYLLRRKERRREIEV